MSSSRTPFDGRVVIDLTSDIAGSYCARLLSDLGADVWKFETGQGHPLRYRMRAPASSGKPGALFRHLAAGQRSILLPADAAQARRLLMDSLPPADAVLWSPGSPGTLVEPGEMRRWAPESVICAITDYGLDGPWVDRPSSELTLQAWCGGIAGRGAPDRPPVQVGGEIGEWTTGMFAAVAVATGWYGRESRGGGDLVDVSKLEALAITVTTMYPVTFASVVGRPYRHRRATNIPDVHPARDGYVGFMCVTGQQMQDFFCMIGCPHWADDPSLVSFWGRDARRHELLQKIDEWTAEQTVAEILELASLMRIPAAPVANGRTLQTYEHLIEQKFLRRNPSGFMEPAPTFWCSSYGQVDEPAAAPSLGSDHIDTLRALPALANTNGAHYPDRSSALPFTDLRVVDFTQFWAGPIVGNYLATLGADVIKVESATRLDSIRYQTRLGFDEPNWWEFGGLFQGVNTNKRSVSIDMASEAGRSVAERLIEKCDVVVENFSPRVLDSWGLGEEQLRQLHPGVVLVRMPAYGLDGPWRDWTGYAQTIEMVSGMTWMTGYPDGAPTVPNGPCDPIAGMHSTFALIAALIQRRRTGRGGQVTAPMVGGGLRVCAEQIVEASAYGNVRQRDGNRSPDAAPQGVYRSADVDAEGNSDRWVAISVLSDNHWAALRHALGEPDWTSDPIFETLEGRRVHHDILDDHLATWCARRRSAATVDDLLTLGVPAAVAVMPHQADCIEQLRARAFFSTVEHPLLGNIVVSGYPSKFERVGAWHPRAMHLLGEDNHDVLSTIAGLSDEEYRELERRGVIGGVPGANSSFTA